MVQESEHGSIMKKKSIIKEIENYYLDSLYQEIVFHNIASDNWNSNIPNRYILSISSYINKSEKKKILHGVRYIYHNDQSLARLDNFNFGKLDGTSYTFFKGTNFIKSKSNYKDGLLNGKYIKYYPDQIIEEEGYYLNGNKIGKWIYYHPNGKIKQEGEYSSDYLFIKFENFEDFKLIVLSENMRDTIPEDKYTSQIKKTLEYLKNNNETYPYKMYIKKGTWVYKDTDGNIERTEVYDKRGNLVKKEKNKSKQNWS